MKKAMSLFLALIILLGMCACGNSNTEKDPKESTFSEGSSQNPESMGTQPVGTESTGTSFANPEPDGSQPVGSESVGTGSEDKQPNGTDSSTTEHTHSYTQTVTKPTCTAGGYTTNTCTCGNSYKSDETAALGHTAVADAAVRATCTTAGKTEGSHCGRCNAVLTAQTTISAKGHSFTDGKCSVCGAPKTSEGLAFTEEYGHYIVAGIGTCTDSNIVIPSTYNGLPVSGMANDAFMGCTSIHSVVIPESMTYISSSAFEKCTNLVSANIPANVTEIHSAAFRGCSSLKSIELHSGITSISEYAFKDCSSLTEVTIPDSITKLNGYTFENCTSLVSVSLPEGLKIILSSVFKNCTGLTSIEIPATIILISDNVFNNCTSLTSISFNGTKEEWWSCSLGIQWYKGVPTQTVTCTDGTVLINGSDKPR